MILSVHLVDAGPLAALNALRDGPRVDRTPGLLWAQRAFTVPLGASPHRPPLPDGIALLAAWSGDNTLEAALATDDRFTGGWHARLQPLRSVGAWSQLPGLPGPDPNGEIDEPVAVLTLGRLRLRRALPFLRASHPAERRAITDPAVVLGTALACPPRFVATFSLWRSAVQMRRYATAPGGPHVAAMGAHARTPFHHESLFARFRPYRAGGAFRGITGPQIS